MPPEALAARPPAAPLAPEPDPSALPSCSTLNSTVSPEGEHVVPAAQFIAGLQRPLAQRWNHVVMQFHCPSCEQDEPTASSRLGILFVQVRGSIDWVYASGKDAIANRKAKKSGKGSILGDICARDTISLQGRRWVGGSLAVRITE